MKYSGVSSRPISPAVDLHSAMLAARHSFAIQAELQHLQPTINSVGVQRSVSPASSVDQRSPSRQTSAHNSPLPPPRPMSAPLPTMQTPGMPGMLFPGLYGTMPPFSPSKTPMPQPMPPMGMMPGYSPMPWAPHFMPGFMPYPFPPHHGYYPEAAYLHGHPHGNPPSPFGAASMALPEAGKCSIPGAAKTACKGKKVDVKEKQHRYRGVRQRPWGKVRLYLVAGSLSLRSPQV